MRYGRWLKDSKQTVFFANGQKYWVNSYSAIEAMAIRRCDALGEYASYFDEVAASYDTLYQDMEHESRAAIQMADIAPGQDVLDIGSGTGLLLDMRSDIKREHYVGVEPSSGMLAEARRKHPGYTFLPCTFEDYWPRRKFDRVVALFGAAAEVKPYAWMKLEHMMRPSGEAFLMFYDETYTPKAASPTRHPAPAGLDLWRGKYRLQRVSG